MNGSWWLDIRNIAAVAQWMADGGYSAHEVAAMVEKPWKYNDEWVGLTARREADEVPGWNGAGADVEAARG